MDPVLDTDWAAHWRELVAARRRQAGGTAPGAGWELRAPGYARAMKDRSEPVVGLLGPWLEPARTLIDVGAGTGRHAVPLAARLDWVTAVEPSEAMRREIPATDNMTVIAAEWADADPAPADLVLCSHVLYAVDEPVPFVEKLERAARLAVFVVLRDSPNPHPVERMAAGRARQPRLSDLFLLLRQIGIEPGLTMFGERHLQHFDSLEAAEEDCRVRAGPAWSEAAGRAWLAEHLRPAPAGGFVYDAGTVSSGLLHWRPRR